jgi:putative transcriptional regulator
MRFISEHAIHDPVIAVAAGQGRYRIMSSQPTQHDADFHYLDGQFLVAMPGMADERFSRAVIYVCAHSAEGAMGIVLNRPASNVSVPDLLVQLEIIPELERIRLPQKVGRMQVLMGGPVETSRGFVLHSPDFHIAQSTLPIDDEVCLTATVDILRAIARGDGPKNAILALGYAGWGAGQLELELQANGWLNCPADAELIFDASADVRYELALRRIGIDPAMLSMQAGHA